MITEQASNDVETSYDSTALGFPPHQIPQRPHMPSLRGLGTDRDPNHPVSPGSGRLHPSG